MLYCGLLCDSSLLIMNAKDKKSEVFSYFKKVQCEFLARSHTFARAALLGGIARTATGRACNVCKTLGQLGLVCVYAQTRHKCNFPNNHFLDPVVRNNIGLQALKTKPATAFPEIVYITVILSTFLLVTVLWIVWTCDCCFFADFLMVKALLVKNYQIKLLKEVWNILVS